MSRSGTANLLLRIVDSSDPMRRDLDPPEGSGRIHVPLIAAGCAVLAAAVAIFFLR